MKKIFLFLIVCLLFGNCEKKYEEDMWLHLRKPSERLTRFRWKVKSLRNLYSNAYPMSCRLEDMQLSFRRTGASGGGCSAQNGPFGPIKSYQYDLDGTWTLIEGDSKIHIINKTGHFCDWTILQLDRKKLKIISDSVELTCIANGDL